MTEPDEILVPEAGHRPARDYSRPRGMTTTLVILSAIVFVAMVFQILTYKNVNTATTQDVLGNRSVIDRLADDEQRRELEETEHRGRNEISHACQIWLMARILRDLGDPVKVNVVANPCDVEDPIGIVPPLPTTTTAPRQRTTTSQRRSTTTTARRTTTSPTTTVPSTATTHCAVKVRDRCVR